MGSHVDCIPCIVNKADKLADKFIENKKDKHRFMQLVLEEIANTDFERTSPLLDAKMMRIAKREFGIHDAYKQEKRFFNEKLLYMEKDIEALLNESKDRLCDALKIAMAGNIIDFSALRDVDLNLVKETVNNALSKKIDLMLFDRFKNDLINGRNLLYLGDNTGEIVLDKIFIRELKATFPYLDVTFATRGKPILNDVNEEDAYSVGMDRFAKIINNGTDLPGTDLLEVSKEFKEVFDNADIIISKGQGNFETLNGCGKNIYYVFLCKCDLFMKKLNAGRFASIFAGEI